VTTILSTLIAVFVTIPFLGYLICFIIAKEIFKNHKKAVYLAIDVMTFLLITSVHFIMLAIWKESYFWVILLVMFSFGMIFVFIHWKTQGEIVYKKVLKGFWRLNFLVFLTAYFGLIVYGLIIRVINTI
jgi:hypothetical protein